MQLACVAAPAPRATRLGCTFSHKIMAKLDCKLHYLSMLPYVESILEYP